jgi:hypothetical protein
MNAKRLVLACVAVFAVMFFYDWLFHEVLLKSLYIATANLWRPPAEMQAHFAWLALGQVALSVMFCVVYATRARATDRAGAGVAYGLLIALLLSAPGFITHAVQPMPLRLIAFWAAGRIVQLMIAGAILGAIYRPTTAVATTLTQQAPAAAS